MATNITVYKGDICIVAILLCGLTELLQYKLKMNTLTDEFGCSHNNRLILLPQSLYDVWTLRRFREKCSKHINTHQWYYKYVMDDKNIKLYMLNVLTAFTFVISIFCSTSFGKKIYLFIAIILNIIANILVIYGYILNTQHMKLMLEYQTIKDAVSNAQNDDIVNDKNTAYNKMEINRYYRRNCHICNALRDNYYHIHIKKKCHIKLAVNDIRKRIFHEILRNKYNLYIPKDIMFLIFDVYHTTYFDIYGNPFIYDSLQISFNDTMMFLQNANEKKMSKHIEYFIDGIYVLLKNNSTKLIKCDLSYDIKIKINVTIKTLYNPITLIKLIQLLQKYDIEYDQYDMIGIWNLSEFNTLVKLHELFDTIKRFVAANDINDQCVNIKSRLILREKFQVDDIWLLWIKWTTNLNFKQTQFWPISNTFRWQSGNQMFSKNEHDDPLAMTMNSSVVDIDHIECIHRLTQKYETILSLHISQNIVNEINTIHVTKIEANNKDLYEIECINRSSKSSMFVAKRRRRGHTHFNNIEIKLSDIKRESYTLDITLPSGYLNNCKRLIQHLPKVQKIKGMKLIQQKRMKTVYQNRRDAKYNKKQRQSKHTHMSRKNKRYLYHRW